MLPGGDPRLVDVDDARLSEVVSSQIRSAPGTNCQPDDGTIGGVGNIGGTAIQPSGLGVIVKIPAPVRFTQTSITSMKGGTAIGRMNCPMFVSSICAGVTGTHEVGRIGPPPASVAPVVRDLDGLEAILDQRRSVDDREPAVQAKPVVERPVVGDREPVPRREAVDIRSVEEAADLREDRDRSRRADTGAEALTAQEAHPVAELDAEALELELLREALHLLGVFAQVRRGQPLQCRLVELPERAGELEHLPDLRLELAEREDPAQPQADEQAPPLQNHSQMTKQKPSNPAADSVSPTVSQRFASTALLASANTSSFAASLPMACPAAWSSGIRCGALDLDRVADHVTHEAVVDRRDPVAEQVAEARGAGLVDELVPGIAIPFLDGSCHQLDGLFVGGELRDELRELADFRELLLFGRRRPGELEAEQDRFLAAQPVAYDLTPFGQLVALEELRHRFPVLGAEGVDGSAKDLLVDGERRHRLGAFEHLVQKLSIGCWFCHCISSELAVDEGARRGRTSTDPANAGLAIEGVAPRRGRPLLGLPPSSLCVGTEPPRRRRRCSRYKAREREFIGLLGRLSGQP